MHVCQCIFLGRSEVSEDTSSILFFSREFGKIRAFRKEGKKQNYSPLDIGTLFEATLETKNSSNRMVSAKIRKSFSPEWYTYSEIKLFLETFDILRKHLHEGSENREIFELVTLSLELLSPGNTERILSLFLVKLSMILGIFEFPGAWENPNLIKILRALEQYPFKTVTNIVGITPELITALKSHASLAFHRHLL